MALTAVSQILQRIQTLPRPTAQELGSDIYAWLNHLVAPCVFFIAGENTSRTRVVSTLLHGNEPSGLMAVHRWLRLNVKPPVNLALFIGNVWAAREEPNFTLRQLAQGRDLNRCFKAPYTGAEGRVAKEFLDYLRQLKPEALVDIHNTSGTGPSFAVSIRDDPAHRALTALFTERMMYTEIRLGALMEYSEQKVPSVTIECGGAQDELAHQCAYDGLLRFIALDNLFAPVNAGRAIEVLTNPVRIELAAQVIPSYGDTPVKGAALTLRPDIEHFNFGVLQPDIPLGWTNDKGLENFTVRSLAGNEVREQVLQVRENRLYVAQPIKAFMITTNPSIAASDCLFYAVTENGTAIV